MPRIRFEGQVFPTGLNMTVRQHPIVQATVEDYVMQFQATIQGGEVIVDCDVESYNEATDQARLLALAFDLANASVNLAAFSIGASAVVVFETFVDPEGARRLLVLRDRPLASLCTAFSHEREDFDEVLFKTCACQEQYAISPRRSAVHI